MMRFVDIHSAPLVWRYNVRRVQGACCRGYNVLRVQGVGFSRYNVLRIRVQGSGATMHLGFRV